MQITDEQKVKFTRLDRWALWDNGVYLVSDNLTPSFQQILNGGGGSKIGINVECNFSHFPLNANNLQNFSSVIHWALRPVIIEASEEFTKWYTINRTPYEPIDWLHSCYGIDE